jgi:hypothetical protein
VKVPLFPPRSHISTPTAPLTAKDNGALAGWGPEEIAAALYELTDTHLTGLRETEVLEGWFLNIKSRE